MPWGQDAQRRHDFDEMLRRGRPTPKPPWEDFSDATHYVHVVIEGGSDSSLEVARHELAKLPRVNHCELWKPLSDNEALFVTLSTWWDKTVAEDVCEAARHVLNRLTRELDLRPKEPTVKVGKPKF